MPGDDGSLTPRRPSRSGGGSRAAEPHRPPGDDEVRGRLGDRDGHPAHRVDGRARLRARLPRHLDALRALLGGSGQPTAARDPHDVGDDRQTDLRRGAGTDVEADRGVDAGTLLVGRLHLVEHRGTPGATRDQADVSAPGIQSRTDHTRLVAPVARDDHHRRLGGHARPPDRFHRVLDAPREVAHGLGDGRVPEDGHHNRGHPRFEEDLGGPTGHARVDRDRRSRGVGELAGPGGQHPQEHALPSCEHRAGRFAHGTLGALPADEPLDRAVGEDECPVARMCGRRWLRPHDRRFDERSSFTAQLLRPHREIHVPVLRSLHWHPPVASLRSAGSRGLHGLPHPRRRQRHIGVPDAERLQRVDDRVDDRGWRTDGGGFADALRADRMVRRRGDGERGLERRHLEGRGDQIVHERTAQAGAVLVERDHLHQAMPIPSTMPPCT